jgi:cyclophilin family peptidyl-prolyl cis-trans isomerase
VVAACLLLTLLITGCSESASDAQKPNSGDDVGELAPGASRDKDSADSADTAGPVVTAHAVITTDLGKFTIELYGEDAPNGVENFIGLVREGYYDSLRFHRVVEDFVVQTGDSLTRDSAAREIWGTGGRSFFGKPFESELDPESPTGRLGYSAGTVAMAGDGGNNLSQFFIVLTDKAGLQLPYRHTIIGRVVEGMETVRKIEATGRTTFESPDGEGIEEGFVQVPPVPAMIREVEVNNSKLTIKN